MVGVPKQPSSKGTTCASKDLLHPGMHLSSADPTCSARPWSARRARDHLLMHRIVQQSLCGASQIPDLALVRRASQDRAAARSETASSQSTFSNYFDTVLVCCCEQWLNTSAPATVPADRYHNPPVY